MYEDDDERPNVFYGPLSEREGMGIENFEVGRPWRNSPNRTAAPVPLGLCNPHYARRAPCAARD